MFKYTISQFKGFLEREKKITLCMSDIAFIQSTAFYLLFNPDLSPVGPCSVDLFSTTRLLSHILSYVISRLHILPLT